MLPAYFSEAPPPYSARGSEEPFLAPANGPPRKPPSYVVSAINARRTLSPCNGVEASANARPYSGLCLDPNVNPVAVHLQIFTEMFEGVVSGFRDFDLIARDRFIENSTGARRLMESIRCFDLMVADLFSHLPAVVNQAGPGRFSHPCVKNLINAITPLEQALVSWAPSSTRLRSARGDQLTLAINATVHEIQCDLQAVRIALHCFKATGLLSASDQASADNMQEYCTKL